MIKVDAMGDTCPIPVVKTKNAIKELKGSGEVQTLVDNEIAVQNLTKMANSCVYFTLRRYPFPGAGLPSRWH